MYGAYMLENWSATKPTTDSPPGTVFLQTGHRLLSFVSIVIKNIKRAKKEHVGGVVDYVILKTNI